MIKIENTEVFGWEAAIRGMRSPMNSWSKSDSSWDIRSDRVEADWYYRVGENDLKLMRNLSKAGSDHGKFLRMINVTMDITCHQVWWAEFDTYKVGTVRNSCSKMHKIHVKEFVRADFSTEGIDSLDGDGDFVGDTFERVLDTLNYLRERFNTTQDKRYWRALIELLPSGYNMRATVQLNYQVLKAMYFARNKHKLDEWKEFCAWVETLPYFKEIVLEEKV